MQKTKQFSHKPFGNGSTEYTFDYIEHDDPIEAILSLLENMERKNYHHTGTVEAFIRKVIQNKK